MTHSLTELYAAKPAWLALSLQERQQFFKTISNWLNDASKDQPDWVHALCDHWLAVSMSTATVRICRRTIHSIRAKNQH